MGGGYRGAAMRSWAELLGDEGAAPESDEEAQGLFGRLRDSLGKSRRALTDQLAVAAFDPADDGAWERLEEALIAADVGVPATAELVQRLEARGGRRRPDRAARRGGRRDARRAGDAERRRAPERRARRRRQRHRQDDDDRQARVSPARARALGDRRGRRHVSRRRRGAARDLGRPRAGGLRRLGARGRSGGRRLRRDRGGLGARPRRRRRRHGRPPAHAGEPDGGAGEDPARDRRAGSKARRTRRCSSSTRRPARTACARRRSSARPSR